MSNPTNFTHATPRATALLIPLLALLAACASLGPSSTMPTAPPDYVVVKAIGLASGSALESLLIDHEFQAEAQAPLKSSIDDPAHRLVMARAEARHTALMRLAQGVAEYSLPGGKTVAQLREAHPDLKPDLDRLIQTRSSVRFSRSNGICRATATLPGSHLTGLLQPLIEPSPGIDPDLPPREAARQAAIANGRHQLRERLMQLDVEDAGENRNLGETLLARNRLDRLDELVAQAQPDEVHHPHEEICEVTFFFDGNRARALIQTRWRDWLPW